MNNETRAYDSWIAVFANDNDALVPEIWAKEGLMLLENEMVMGNLVHRDFDETEISAYGDTVNAHRPADFEAKRKSDSDTIDIQDATAANVQVKLNQHMYTSFIIKDGEESKSFLSLVNMYLAPAMTSIAQRHDQMLLSQVYRFRSNAVGNLGTAPVKSTVIGARALMNTNKVPQRGRNLVVSPNMEASLLNISEFVNAEKIGDDGTALREGSIGRKFGFDIYMDQNTPSIPTGNSVDATLTTTAIEPIGETTIAVSADPTTKAIAGEYLTIAGDDTVQKVVSTTSGTIVITPGLKRAVAASAAIVIYKAGAVDEAAGYMAGYPKELTVDGFTVAPNPGQLVGIGSDEYAAANTPTLTSLDLDIPMLSAAANNAPVNIGPEGEYGFAFHREALALVNRPLALPSGNVSAAVINANGISMRVVITYDPRAQGHIVTLDTLSGVGVLNDELGAVMYG